MTIASQPERSTTCRQQGLCYVVSTHHCRAILQLGTLTSQVFWGKPRRCLRETSWQFSVASILGGTAGACLATEIAVCIRAGWGETVPCCLDLRLPIAGSSRGEKRLSNFPSARGGCPTAYCRFSAFQKCKLWIVVKLAQTEINDTLRMQALRNQGTWEMAQMKMRRRQWGSKRVIQGGYSDRLTL